MALSIQAKGKLLEIFEALDARLEALKALQLQHTGEMQALVQAQYDLIKPMVIEFKQLGGTNADLPLAVQEEIGFAGT